MQAHVNVKISMCLNAQTFISWFCFTPSVVYMRMHGMCQKEYKGVSRLLPNLFSNLAILT